MLGTTQMKSASIDSLWRLAKAEGVEHTTGAKVGDASHACTYICCYDGNGKPLPGSEMSGTAVSCTGPGYICHPHACQ